MYDSMTLPGATTKVMVMGALVRQFWLPMRRAPFTQITPTRRWMAASSNMSCGAVHCMRQYIACEAVHCMGQYIACEAVW